jgi:UDP-N-acetyl-2-amino-2-deoxyglucuronate dehydrogenase
MRTGIIGCGKVGQTHALALSRLPQSEFIAACDAQRVRAEAVAARYGAKPFDSVPRMLAECRLDAVTICTPHPLHAQAAIQAAEAGVHVLVEKPMAATLADCDAMLAAAHRANVKLGIVSQRRLFEPVQRMKAAIDAGKIGRPMLGLFLMYSWRDQAYYQSDPWRGRWQTEGGGVLVNQSPHQLDLLQWFLGPIDELHGYWANANHPTIEVEDTAVATIRFQSGALASILTSVAQNPGIYTKVHVHGDNGASIGVETDTGASFVAGVSQIVHPPLNDLWTIPGEEHLLPQFQADDRRRFHEIDATTHYHERQIADFLSAILEDRPPLVPGEQGRLVVEIFTALYRSQQLGRPVKFPVQP